MFGVGPREAAAGVAFIILAVVGYKYYQKRKAAEGDAQAAYLREGEDA